MAEDRCVVLMFDNEKFFSTLNHKKLKVAWNKLLENGQWLPDDHFNIFKATTQFKYILHDDLRLDERINGRRPGFDERKLSEIRKFDGVEAFYENNEAFRQALMAKEITVYKKQFVKKRYSCRHPPNLAN